MMTLTHGGESVNMDCEYADGTISCMIADGTELADGSYTVAINRKLAKNQQTFTVDNTAPTVDNVKYVADRDNDLQNGGEVLAFNSLDSREQAKRSLTFSVNESGRSGSIRMTSPSAVRTRILDGNEHDLQDAYEVDVRPNHQVEVTFTKPGSYDFGNIKIEVKGQSGERQWLPDHRRYHWLRKSAVPVDDHQQRGRVADYQHVQGHRDQRSRCRWRRTAVVQRGAHGVREDRAATTRR